jgi:hypothetical protein
MKAIGVASTFPAEKLQEADAIAGALQQIRVIEQDGKLQVSV